MSVEKICEYFNDIGILQLDDMNRFLKIYTQISQNKFKNKSDKLILSLFSYITQLSQNDQQLYDTCKNIVNSFSNTQILHRYRAIYMIINIIKSKINSKYILFFCKLISIINKKHIRSKINSSNSFKLNNRNLIKNFRENEGHNDGAYFTGRNIIRNNIKKGKIVKNFSGKKNRLNPDNNKNMNENNNINNNNNCRTFDFNENENECTFSPKINKNYKPKKINKPSLHINDEIESSSLYDKSNFNKGNLNINKNHTKIFKHSENYANNNKINNELEKMIENISKFGGSPNNSKYIPQKTIYRATFNQMYPNDSYNEMPYNSYPNMDVNKSSNDFVNNYIEDDYDFYQKEEDHIKKVQDKIFQLQLEKIDKISRECTFTPEINEVPKYLIENKNQQNNLKNINYNYEENYKNNIYNLNNDNLINNSFINSQSFSKRRKNKISEEFTDDYYNVYPKKRRNRSKDSRSYSNSKGKNNEYGIYKARKEELMKQIKEQYPFMPSIKENKNFKIKSTFDERQKKFIEDKEKKFKEKQKEELKEIEEMKKYYNKSKANIKELVKKLYDEEAIKIKERLKNEREAKSKKKKIIDWDKRNKKNKEKYPEEYKINYKPKNKPIMNNNLDQHLDNLIQKIEKEKEKSNSPTKKNKKNNSNRKNLTKKKKNKNEVSTNLEEINKNKQILLEKIKDEHVIGFKNNSNTNQNKYNFVNKDKVEIKADEKKEDEKKDDEKKENNDNLATNTINTMKSESLNLDNYNVLSTSEKKDFQDEHLLEGINKRDGIKSNAMQQIMNQIHNNNN